MVCHLLLLKAAKERNVFKVIDLHKYKQPGGFGLCANLMHIILFTVSLLFMNGGIAVTERIPSKGFELDIEAAVGKRVFFLSVIKLVLRVLRRRSVFIAVLH